MAAGGWNDDGNGDGSRGRDNRNRVGLSTSLSTDPAQSRCFELLGFDIILDEALRPWLLEVNHSPSFAVESALDERIKSRMLSDLLQALGQDPRDRRAWLSEERRRQRARLYTPQPSGMSFKGKFLRETRAMLVAAEKVGMGADPGGDSESNIVDSVATMETLRSRWGLLQNHRRSFTRLTHAQILFRRDESFYARYFQAHHVGCRP